MNKATTGTGSWIVERVNGNSTRPLERGARTVVARHDDPADARITQRELRAGLRRGSADWFEVRRDS